MTHSIIRLINILVEIKSLSISESQNGSFFLQFPWCVGEFNKRQPLTRNMQLNFNSRGAWGSSTRTQWSTATLQSFQFPWCVGKFNMFPKSLRQWEDLNFNSRGAWGSSTSLCKAFGMIIFISIPVVRGGVQPEDIELQTQTLIISIPVVRGGVQRQAFILPDLSGFQSLISRIANKPKTNTTQ